MALAPVGDDGTVYGNVGDFIIVSTSRTTLVRSSISVEDVEEIQAETVPHRVFFIRYVPYASFDLQFIEVLVTPIAFAIESILGSGLAVGATFVQDLDASNLLTNAMEFTVQVQSSKPGISGPFTTTVTIPIQTLHDTTDFAPFFAGAISNLQAVAG
jgi:hypothetical protein